MTERTGRTWLITGASSGIGRKLAERVLAQGDRVAAILRVPARLADLEQAYPDKLSLFTQDLADTRAIPETVACILDRMGWIDIVLSGAGYVLVGAAEEASDTQIAHQLSVNLLAPIMLIKAVLPHLRERRAGRIIQISSEGGQIAYPSASLYHAGKWGVEGFCEALAQEIRSFGIAVTLVEPGRVATGFEANAVLAETPIEDYRRSTVGQYLKLVQMGRFPSPGDPDKVARVIVDLAADPAPPLRMTLGSDAIRNVGEALRKRLTALEAQAPGAAGTDAGGAA
jgi:NAD(P)-dependent dehydrogenase (short-subunit alcohol dehydrogenase family)